MRKLILASTIGCLAWLPAGAALSEVPSGTRFMVELRKKLEAKKVKPGKSFEARTLEALRADDGNIIASGTKLKGRVSYADNNKLVLRFEQIETSRGKVPIVASVVGVPGERDVKRAVGSEGEIRADGGRGKGAATGAVILGGIGAVVGGTQAGRKGAAIGAGTGAATGAAIGAAAGGKDLVLQEGTRIELALDRPLTFERK